MFRLLRSQRTIQKSFILKRSLCDCSGKCELAEKIDNDTGNGFVQQMSIGAFCVASGGVFGLSVGPEGLIGGMILGCLVAMPAIGLNAIVHLAPRGSITLMNCKKRHGHADK